MKNLLDVDMHAATRLTRAGRLGEAVEALQRRLGGRVVERSDDVRTIDGVVDGKVTDTPVVGRLLAGLERLFAPHARPADPAPRESRTAQPLVAASPRPRERESTFVSGHFADTVGARPYKLFIPSGAEPGQPLIVMLHGCTQSADDFAAGTRMNALAKAQGCLVLYPEQIASANMQRCWNWYGKGNQQRDEGEAALIARMTHAVIQEHAIDPARVYVAGLSAGGAAAAILGSVYPDVYAAIGVHSGLACGAATDMQSAFAAMRSGNSGALRNAGGRVIPAIVFHGDRDATVHPRNADAVAAQVTALRELRTESRTGQVPGGHVFTRTISYDPAGVAVLEQWVIHGADHAWSGGSREGSFTDPLGPDASKEMLRFFLSHRHRPAAG